MQFDPSTLYSVVVAASTVTALLLWSLAGRSVNPVEARSWAIAFALLSLYFVSVLYASALPPLIGIGLANGLAIGVMAVMHRSAALLCRQSFQPWGHLVAVVLVTVVIILFLQDIQTAYSARVQLVGMVTAFQGGLVSLTLARSDGSTCDEERGGRRLLALSFGALAVMQALRVLAHSPWVVVTEPAILSRSPLSAAVAIGFLTWSITVPVLVFYVHESRARHALRATASDLREALAEVRTLRDLLPMCASCRRIRNEQDQWSTLETYLLEHSGVHVSHGLCPDCIGRLYPEFAPPPRP